MKTKTPIVVAVGVLLLAAGAQAQPAPAEKKPADKAGAQPAKPPGAKPPAAKPPAGKPPAAPPADAAEEPADGEEPGTEPSEEPGTEPSEEPTEEPTEEPPTRPRAGGAPTQRGTPTMPGFQPLPTWPKPGSDSQALQQQGDKRPGEEAAKRDADQVYAEDWWSHARPIFELHGYYRLRAELFHNFSLGRIDDPNKAIWPMPADNHYNGRDTAFGPALCTGKQAKVNDSTDPAAGLYPCKDKTQAGANMRFRLNPELHISDNLRIVSQIDLLDNLVLGSTPNGYANSPAEFGGYGVVKRSGYTPLGAFDTTQVPPNSGNNSFKDSVQVKRVWAEYLTPVGQLRFGRMPSHWGLGILAHAGDGYDDDYQTTADRIMFVTGIKSLDLYFAGAWDFPNEGATSQSLNEPQGQPYDLAQLDDVNQYVFVVMRRKNPELTKLALAKGDVVLNGGAYVVYRKQLLANDTSGACNGNSAAIGCRTDAVAEGYVRRGAEAWIPDLWVQLLYKKFRFEAEFVTIQGSIENLRAVPQTSDYVNADGENGWKLRQYGYALELEQKLVEDRLRLEFMHGWASGDAGAVGSSTNNLSPGDGLQPQLGDRTISTFRFNPNYKVDLILNRNLLTRVQGTYYFRPSVEYDFVRNPNGQRFGGGFAAIWTRASEFVQTPGHKRDLGVELNLSLYFQSKDGALNDDPDKMGGFYTMLQWGVLFPMGGLGYQSIEGQDLEEQLRDPGASDTSTAQILRWYLGVMF